MDPDQPLEVQVRSVSRPEVLEIIRRKNELEQAVPVYRQALEHIADSPHSGPWGRIADKALREALFRDGED